MALIKTGDKHYLKITGVTTQTVPAVTGAEIEIDNHDARLDVTVQFNIFRSEEERHNPDPEFSHYKSDSQTFDHLPEAPDKDTPYNHMITSGYLLLKEVLEGWEDA